MKLTREVVRELLHYDPDSGIVTWRERDRRWFKSDRDCRAWNTQFSGKRAGSVWTNRKTGYRRREIKILGRDYKEHRLAWMWKTDDPLPPQIDHENRDGTDNRWLNLRPATRIDNGRNQSMSRRNTSGVTGVGWDKAAGKWRAQCKINRKQKHLGYFDELGEAAKAVAKFRADRGFDPGHGAEIAHYHT